MLFINSRLMCFVASIKVLLMQVVEPNKLISGKREFRNRKIYENIVLSLHLQSNLG